MSTILKRLVVAQAAPYNVCIPCLIGTVILFIILAIVSGFLFGIGFGYGIHLTPERSK
jgi:predicted RND superfamily exporter protein